MLSKVHVILDNIRSALNVGAIFRTCDAVAIEKLWLVGITPYPPHNKIPKTALGSIENVSWEYVKNQIEVINFFEKQHIPLLAIENTPEASNIFLSKLPQKCAFVFGNEIGGISEPLLQASKEILKLPMFGIKESLNVATTCGIVMYEALRQTLYN